MQLYTLLGTAQIKVSADQWHSFWDAQECDHRVTDWGGIIKLDVLTVEYETDWDLSVEGVCSFLIKGQLNDDLELLTDFVNHVKVFDGSLNLDLFGDAARLVRRIIT
jgi:hypothetical protein